jgi:hypothetical protein
MVAFACRVAHRYRHAFARVADPIRQARGGGAAHRGSAECSAIPIGAAPDRADNWPMVQVTIRCHPLVPVPADELEHWLSAQVHHLRAEAPQGTVRLSRLTQELPTTDLDVGWLLELELPEDEPLLSRRRLAEALTDMRLLGLEPTLMAPVELSGWSAPKSDSAAAAVP